MASSPAASTVADELLPTFLAERAAMSELDRWYRWEHDAPHAPRTATAEYRELIARAQTPWLRLVVTSVAQALYVEGYRRADSDDNAAPWAIWQANKLDARQVGIHRAALAYGSAYALVLPGTLEVSPGSTVPMPVIRGISPRSMVTFWRDEADDWPELALRGDPTTLDNGDDGWLLTVYDDVAAHRYLATTDGDVTYLDHEEHAVGVCPVVRYANELDLEGRSTGEVEPFIPVAARIDQTTFDRLVVQRFASWIVRTVVGMSKPDDAAEADAARLRLKVEDLLIAEDPDTKFGSLPATPLDGFIEARDADIRDLAAVTQTPPHHLLGQMANLSAEALAAAESSLSRKIEERKHSFGEAHEQTLRLAAYIAGDVDAAEDTAAQVRWRDTESRSLAQTADALGKLATLLGVPPVMLWEKIPGWTDQDVERARSLAAESSALDNLLAELVGGQTSPDGVPPPEAV